MDGMSSLWVFFYDNFPTLKQICIFGPLFTMVITCELIFSGYLKFKYQLQTGISRKIFHFITFFSVSIIQFNWGLPLMCLYGACCCFIVIYSTFKGSGFIMYEAMAREKDAPKRTLFILIPLIATFLGGVSSNILFPSIAFCGYLIAGIGDAVGELIGTPFGKHKYAPLSKLGIHNKKSYEGSFAVFVFSLIVLLLVLPQIQSTPFPQMIMLSLMIAFLATLVEAYSPPACDNFLMQVVPNCLIYYFV